jgi:hypothetical protein
MNAFIPPSVVKQMNHLEEIYTFLRKGEITFSKTAAAKIVGGRGVLERLVARGKIRVNGYSGSLGKWHCNAEDVLRYVNYKEKEN